MRNYHFIFFAHYFNQLDKFVTILLSMSRTRGNCLAESGRGSHHGQRSRRGGTGSKSSPEHPATFVEAGPPSVLDVSPAQRTSSLSRHYVRLLSDRPLNSWRELQLGPVELRQPPFLGGLLSLSDNMEPFSDKVLSNEGTSFEACTITWPLLRKTILKQLLNVASALEDRLPLKFQRDNWRGGRGCGIHGGHGRLGRLDRLGNEQGSQGTRSLPPCTKCQSNEGSHRGRATLTWRAGGGAQTDRGKNVVIGMDPTSSKPYVIYFFSS